ncbi:MAG: GIY-YIG nuclease family protein [Parcubacteria group bacterium]
MPSRINRTDRVVDLRELRGELNYEEFEHKDKFVFLCNLIPDVDRERLLIEDEDPNYINKKGLVYLFVFNRKLIKVGSTITTFKDRVTSYNCGRRQYRENGTCSTTNYFVLQTLLRWNRPIQIYAYFPPEIEIDVFGEKELMPSPTKVIEKRILTELNEDGVLPIFCTQR